MADPTSVSQGAFRSVLSLTDSAATLDPHVADGVTAEGLDRGFRKNKLATSALADADVTTSLANQEPLAESMSAHARQLEIHEERIGVVEDLLDGEGWEYLHIKKLRNPYSVMADIDLLVTDADDVVEMSEKLVAEEFTLKQSRLLCHPLKVNAHKYVDGQNNPVDIYPDAIWVRKKVCEGQAVLDRGETTEFGGRTVPVPDPEDSFHLVATHAYAHMRLTLAEVLHGFEMVDADFDWERVVEMARTYGSMDSVYLFVRAMDAYAEAYRAENPVPDWVLSDLRASRPSKKLDAWFETAADPFVLPLQVPRRIACISSSGHYLRRSLGSMSPADTLYGTLTHYVILANQVI